MHLPILKPHKSGLQQFIHYWSDYYDYFYENFYDECIHNKVFSEKDIQKLFIWKNGMNLSKLKQQSLNEKVLARIDRINFLKKQPTFNTIELNSEFKNLSFVWRMFLLHIIKPAQIPMYDQNVHRAYHFVFGKDYQNISEIMSDKQKEDFYFGEYYPFISSIKDVELRQIDRAFFAFGQFLKNQTFSGMLK